MSKFKLCHIEDGYIRFLHSRDSRVQFNKTGRPYVGVVLRVGKLQYFVPLESPKPNHVNIHGGPILKLDGGKLGIMGFNNMLPVPESAMINFDIAQIADEQYRSLLYNQLAFCERNAQTIYGKAESVYKKETTGNPAYKRFCCDFKKLETACISYRPNKRTK